MGKKGEVQLHICPMRETHVRHHTLALRKYQRQSIYQVPLILRFLAYAVYILLWGLVADCYPYKAFTYVVKGNTFIWKYNHAGKDELKMSSANCTFDVISFLLLPFSAALLVWMWFRWSTHSLMSVSLRAVSFARLWTPSSVASPVFLRKSYRQPRFLEDAFNLSLLSPFDHLKLSLGFKWWPEQNQCN